VTCHVSHEKGHRESTSLTGPEDVSGGKNPIQTIGSTVTYLQRYTMVSALGLSTADQDDADKTPPRPDVAMPRAKAAQDAKPEGDVVTGLVEKVTPKTLPNKTVKYGIMVAGQWYSTFLKSVADIATDAQTQGKPVQLAWIKNGEYINVASICVADAEPALTEEEKAAIERGEQ
jgi:hypothetical protein